MLILCFFLFRTFCFVPLVVCDESSGLAFVEELEANLTQLDNVVGEADWAFATNITDETEAKKVEQDNYYDDFMKTTLELAQPFLEEYTSYQDYNLKRKLEVLRRSGGSPKDDSQRARLNELSAEMESIYSSGQVCLEAQDVDAPPPCLNLDPDLEEIMSDSRDYDELLRVWTGWRDSVGKPQKELYTEFINLKNQGARDYGFQDAGERWRSGYDMEDEDFITDIEHLWTQVQPLYEQLHCYTRRKLQEFYEPQHDDNGDGYIPAHLLGNMWAQHWGDIYDLLEPYPGEPNLDASDELVAQNYSAVQMMELGESFYMSLGFNKLPDKFWKKSLFERPDDRDVVCHASAWDFGPDDVRIKMCVKQAEDDLFTIHHEQGHLFYYQSYSDKSYFFRSGANDGFHEAIGDTMQLSVYVPAHLYSIGLLSSPELSDKGDINFLMRMALGKVAFLPFGYLIDKWRWEVFAGLDEELYNARWWELRKHYQGIEPPVSREDDDFDPAAKYHIAADVPYMRYFLAHILQFQFHRALCIKSGYDGPLHKCDISAGDAVNAGQGLINMLSLGSSRPWQEALAELSGEINMDATAILQYFEPLHNWMVEQNINSGDTCGWPLTPEPETEGETEKEPETYVGVNDASEASAIAFLDHVEDALARLQREKTEAEWEFNVNINDETEALSVSASNRYNVFVDSILQDAKMFYEDDVYQEFQDDDVKRKLKLLKRLGGLPTTESGRERYNELLVHMENVYSSGEVCPNAKPCLHLDPELEDLMATSRNYSELLSVWTSWRDEVGRAMLDFYVEFVELKNDGAKEHGYKDAGELWRSGYDMTDEEFIREVDRLWKEVSPLYEELHCYVRSHLKDEYLLNNTKYIPAHVLGNMWAQDWSNIYDLVAPYPHELNLDATNQLQIQNKTALEMVKIGESFFVSLSFPQFPAEFWEKSLFERPKDRDVVCHASSWDFGNNDVRMKMCVQPKEEDLFVIHHEQGHLYYFLMYSDQPYLYRNGANDGFHEAIGDTMGLSVSDPSHLKSIGLLDKVNQTKEAELNFLMKMALEKVAFLPFAYVVDKWRWEVFSGLEVDNYNKRWWELRRKYQGIDVPIKRGINDFDPGAKYHIAADVSYMRYFLADILQFQFHRALCKKSGHEGPLHKCDISTGDAAAAGKAMKDMMSLGAKKSWQDALFEISGERRMDSTAMLDYFSDLLEWLKEDNALNNRECGWKSKQGSLVWIIAAAILGVVIIAVVGFYCYQLKRKRWRRDFVAHSAGPQGFAELDENIQLHVRQQPFDSRTTQESIG